MVKLTDLRVRHRFTDQNVDKQRAAFEGAHLGRDWNERVKV